MAIDALEMENFWKLLTNDNELFSIIFFVHIYLLFTSLVFFLL